METVQTLAAKSEQNKLISDVATFKKLNSDIGKLQKDLSTANLSQKTDIKDIVSPKAIPEIPKVNKFLDFLSTSGKLSVFLLAITPLPTFIGVWNKPKQE